VKSLTLTIATIALLANNTFAFAETKQFKCKITMVNGVARMACTESKPTPMVYCTTTGPYGGHGLCPAS